MADPDLQIRQVPGHPDLEIGRVAVTKKFFSVLWASVWSKTKGCPAPSLDPPLFSKGVHARVSVERQSC